MKNRKVAVACGVAGAIAGIAVGIGKAIADKRRREKYPWNKPGRVWEA